jgi:hypothetical protein
MMVEIEARVWLSLGELIDNDFEGFLDLLSDKATDTIVLQNIEYQIVGLDDHDNIEFRVKGELDEDWLDADEMKKAVEHAEATSRPL